MYMKRKLIYAVMVAGAVMSASCSKYNFTEEKEIHELATSKHEYLIEDSGDDCIIPVYANGPVTVKILEGEVDWARLDRTSLDGDGMLLLEVDLNLGVPRMVNVELSLTDSHMKDTVCVKQKGKAQSLQCLTPYLTISGAGQMTTALDLQAKNIPLEEVQVSLAYSGHNNAWVSSAVIEAGKLTLVTEPNEGYVARRVKCNLYYVNGWGERIESGIYITQSDHDGAVGTDILPVELQAMASEKGFKVLDDLVIEGVIISDCDSRNMELNPMLDWNVVDTLASVRTAYMQTEDGQNGFRLQFENPTENTLHFGTKIRLNLYGCTVTKELDPVRYTVSGVGGANLVGAVTGVTPVEKRKKISQLTDQDIYTYVTLTGTEFPLKRGTYLDIREVSSSDWSANLSGGAVFSDTIDGWATLLIDDEGSGIYAPVNIKCKWRRTGSGLPQGSGDTRGVIVSHQMRRLGDAGRYQIRVIDQTGFDMTEESEYHLHAEWYNGYGDRTNYSKKNSKYSFVNLYTVVPSAEILTNGNTLANGEMQCQNYEGDPGRSNHIDGGTYYIKHILSGTEDGNIGGVGLSYIPMPHGFYQWNESTKQVQRDENGKVLSNGWEFTIQNLKDLNATQYLFVFDFAGGYKTAGVARLYPAHWCLEYSTDGGTTWKPVQKNIHSDEPYVHMRSLPWPKASINGQPYMTSAEAGMGFSQHAFLLPADVVGLNSFKMRLRPYDETVTILPFDWQASTESSHIEYTTTLSGGLRVRFGSLRLYCR